MAARTKLLAIMQLLFTKRNQDNQQAKNLADEIKFSSKEKDQLITMARDNIKSLLYEKKRIICQ